MNTSFKIAEMEKLTGDVFPNGERNGPSPGYVHGFTQICEPTSNMHTGPSYTCVYEPKGFEYCFDLCGIIKGEIPSPVIQIPFLSPMKQIVEFFNI